MEGITEVCLRGLQLYSPPSSQPRRPRNRLGGLDEEVQTKLSPGFGWEEKPPYAVVTSSFDRFLLFTVFIICLLFSTNDH